MALSNHKDLPDSLSEVISLITLKVGKLYPELSDELKMLLLKILLEIYKGSRNNQAMVRKVNDSFVLKDCLARAKTSFENSLNITQTFIIKAFIDFIATVYISEITTILDHL